MRSFFLLFTLFLSISSFAQDINNSVVQRKVMTEIASNPDAFLPIYILLEDQVNFTNLEKDFSNRKVSLEERAFETISKLQEKSYKTQDPFINLLQNSDAVIAESVHPYWIANVIFARAKKSMIAQLSNDPHVSRIGYNGKLERTETYGESTSPVAPESIEPGLAVINAPALWEMGYTGYGRLAYVPDTGVDPTHPAINSNFRGFTAGHPRESWFLYEFDNFQPFDCSDHGTHVLGTTLGLDRQTKDTIGVAFNAQWIGSPILCGIGTEDNIAALQWSLNPDDDATTIDDMPDVINNSWFDPEVDVDCESVYVPVLEATEAAGIAVVFSAGNEGPDPMTITPPHNINLNLVNSFTVAATRHDGSFTAADFSSRGPSMCGGENSLLIKPEVAAPGVAVRSCILNGEYGLKSGTSMAAPHTCGAILLLKEAFPYLTGRDFKLALYNTCTDLGDPGEDNTYGMGMINVEAAFNYLIQQGHIPEPPIRVNDLVMIDSKAREKYCGEMVNIEVVFENAGQDSLFTADIEYTLDSGLVGTYNWEGAAATNDIIEVDVAIEDLPVGNYAVNLELKNPNGNTETRPLNNVFKTNFTVLERTPISANVAYENEYSYCEDADVLLQTEYNGAGTVQWYDAEEQGELLGEGNQFALEAVDTTTTVYFDILYEEKTGLASKDMGANEITDDNDGYIEFDVYDEFTLKSVKVYFDQNGGRIITLYDAQGRGIHEMAVLVAGNGEQVLTLNFKIPEGENYRLVLDQGIPLYQNTANVPYPFVIPDVLTIKSGPENTYSYFYDWEIEYDEVCGRLPIMVEVTPTDSIPNANFEMSTEVVNVDDMEMVTFTDNSTNATDWLWDFGDGNTSTEQNPTHTYSSAGIFYVSLTALNADGCADSFTQTVEVMTDAISATQQINQAKNQIALYPNPTNGLLEMQLQSDRNELIRMEIYDVTGRRVYHLAEKLYLPNEQSFIDIKHLHKGMYYVVFEIDGIRSVKKIVKL